MSARITSIDDLPDGYAKRQLLAARDRETAATIAEAAATGEEAKLHAEVTAWLDAHGFWPRQGKRFAHNSAPPFGWQYHLHAAEENPPLLDILLLSIRDGRYAEIELKTATGKLRRTQQIIIAACGPVYVCRSLADVIAAVCEVWPEIAARYAINIDAAEQGE